MFNYEIIFKKSLNESSSFCVFYWTTVKNVWFDCLLRKYFKGSLEIEYLKLALYSNIYIHVKIYFLWTDLPKLKWFKFKKKTNLDTYSLFFVFYVYDCYTPAWKAVLYRCSKWSNCLYFCHSICIASFIIFTATIAM